MMPTDPVILLSFVNMKLRDEYESLEELCGAYQADCGQITEKLRSIGYVYSAGVRQFVPEKGEML